jgi:integrase
MAKPSRTGVRGLFKEVRYFDAVGVKLNRTQLAHLRSIGARITKEERYYIDLRWRDPKTGKPGRHTERLAPGLSASAAKTRAMEIVNGVAAGTFEKNRETPKRVADALTEYDAWAKVNRPRSYGSKKSLCGILKDKLGHHALDELSPFDVERFKRDRETEGAGPATINRAVAQLKHLYTMALAWGWVSVADKARIHAVGKMKEPPGRVRCLSADEEGKIFGKLSGTMLTIVTAAALTGMRREEFVKLRKDAVDLARKTITLRKTKTNRVRELKISAALDGVLRPALASSPDESPFVFVQTEGRNRGKPYALSSVSQHFRRAKVALGIEDLRLHDIRHDAATKMRRKGIGIDVISKVLGHTQITTTMRYAHVGTELLTEAMDSVPAPIAKPLPDQPRTSEKAPREEKRKAALFPVR